MTNEESDTLTYLQGSQAPWMNQANLTSSDTLTYLQGSQAAVAVCAL